MNTDSSQSGKKLLMISTDRLIFQEGSAVRTRQIEYAKNFSEVHIIVLSNRSFHEDALATNCWAYPTRSRSKFLTAFDAIRLGRFIIEKRGITHMTCQDPFLTAMAGTALKRQFKLPLELQIHTDIGSPYYVRSFADKVRLMMAKSYLPQADTIRAVSARIKEYLTQKLGLEDQKISIRPIFVDTERVKNAPITADLRAKYPQFKRIVLIASRLEPEKNISLALNSWPEVKKAIPDAGLIIVGTGSEHSSLSNQILHLKISDSAIIEKWADQQTLYSFYKTADLFVLTSFFEGYGMTLVEAQAAGIKIISTDVGVAKEVGATIVSNDSRDLAQAIIAALR